MHSRTMDALDGDTAGYRRCVAPDAQSAGGASLRGQPTVGWRGFEPRYQEKRTRRAPLGGFVDYSSSSQPHCVTIQTTKTG